MAATNNFNIDTGDYLGIKYEAFKDEMLALALSEPSEYFKLRKAVLQRVKQQAVEDQFKIYYNLLTAGQTKSGRDILSGGGDPGVSEETARKFVPNYPKQLTSQFALGAAKTIDKIAEEAVEILLPKDYKSISQDRFSKIAEGKMSV
jgi:hypothetical protein